MDKLSGQEFDSPHLHQEKTLAFCKCFFNEAHLAMYKVVSLMKNALQIKGKLCFMFDKVKHFIQALACTSYLRNRYFIKKSEFCF